eukprot:scaffold5226_cov100-Isochrysis_galbana.AAC.3
MRAKTAPAARRPARKLVLETAPGEGGPAVRGKPGRAGRAAAERASGGGAGGGRRRPAAVALGRRYRVRVGRGWAGCGVRAHRQTRRPRPT